MYNREKEIREAISSGECALDALKDARDNLKSAGGWGLFDLLGGGLISGLMKHRKIEEANESLYGAKAALDHFRDELGDVRDIQSLKVEIGDFLTFADFFFDGFFADIMVQSKIHEAQDNLDDAIAKVTTILKRLRASLPSGSAQ